MALRADMDALMVTEETQLPFSSTNDGIMHACGHDGHSAMLLGAAIIINRIKGGFDGVVKFIFSLLKNLLKVLKSLFQKEYSKMLTVS